MNNESVGMVTQISSEHGDPDDWTEQKEGDHPQENPGDTYYRWFFVQLFVSYQFFYTVAEQGYIPEEQMTLELNHEDMNPASFFTV